MKTFIKPSLFAAALGAGIVMLLTGCASAPPADIGPVVSPLTSPLQPAAQSAAPTAVPAPKPGNGHLRGRLDNIATNKPLAGATLRLGALLMLTPGPDFMVNVSQTDSPLALTADDGSFVFTNVAPGRYVIVLMVALESRFVGEPGQPNKERLVEVSADKTTDLGVVQIPAP